MKVNKLQEAALDIARYVGFLHLNGSKKFTDGLLGLWYSECKKADQPFIYLGKRGQKNWQAVADLGTCKVESVAKVDLPALCLRSLTRMGLDKKLPERCKPGETWRWTGPDQCWVFWLSEIEAVSTCQNLQEFIWEARTNPEAWRKNMTVNVELVGNWFIQQKEKERMVKFFKDGKALALQTDAQTEQHFTRDFAIALQDFMTGQNFEGQHEIETYLHNFAEICCKMRGYKAEVKEQRLLTVGDINPASETCVTVTEHGTQMLKAVA